MELQRILETENITHEIFILPPPHTHTRRDVILTITDVERIKLATSQLLKVTWVNLTDQPLTNALPRVHSRTSPDGPYVKYLMTDHCFAGVGFAPARGRLPGERREPGNSITPAHSVLPPSVVAANQEVGPTLIECERRPRRGEYIN